MGTQQVLLIVIGVIVVGAAIAIGITMFNNQGFSANQQAILAEIQNFGTLASAYWKMPTSLGGAGKSMTTADIANLAAHLGFTPLSAKSDVEYQHISENADYRLYEFDNYVMKIQALGKSMKAGNYPLIDMSYSVLTSSSELDIKKGKEFSHGNGNGNGNGNAEDNPGVGPGGGGAPGLNDPPGGGG